MQNKAMNNCWNDEISQMRSLSIVNPIQEKKRYATVPKSLYGLFSYRNAADWATVTTKLLIELVVLGDGYIYWCSCKAIHCLAGIKD